MDFSNLITPEIVSGLLVLVSTFLTYAIHAGVAYLKTKTKNEKISGALSVVDAMLISAVKGTEQTLKSDLIKESKDGILTPNSQKYLRDSVVDSVLTNLTSSAKAEVLKVIPDIEQYAYAKVEDIVHDIKAFKYSGPTADAIIDSIKTLTIDGATNAIKENIPENILNKFRLGDK